MVKGETGVKLTEGNLWVFSIVAFPALSAHSVPVMK